jgi:hypothetical protein
MTTKRSKGNDKKNKKHRNAGLPAGADDIWRGDTHPKDELCSGGHVSEFKSQIYAPGKNPK